MGAGGVAEGRAGGRRDRGRGEQRAASRQAPGETSLYKGVCSACLPQTPQAERGVGTLGIWRIEAVRESRTSGAIVPCPEARRRWTCLRGTAPQTGLGTPTTGRYSPGAPRLLISWIRASRPSGTAPAAVSLRAHLAPFRLLPRALLGHVKSFATRAEQRPGLSSSGGRQRPRVGKQGRDGRTGPRVAPGAHTAAFLRDPRAAIRALDGRVRGFGSPEASSFWGLLSRGAGNEHAVDQLSNSL